MPSFASFHFPYRYIYIYMVNPMWPVNSIRSQLPLIWQICNANINVWFTLMTSLNAPSSFSLVCLLLFLPTLFLASPRPEYQNPATGTTPTTVIMELASWRQSGNNPNYLLGGLNKAKHHGHRTATWSTYTENCMFCVHAVVMYVYCILILRLEHRVVSPKDGVFETTPPKAWNLSPSVKTKTTTYIVSCCFVSWYY